MPVDPAHIAASDPPQTELGRRADTTGEKTHLRWPDPIVEKSGHGSLKTWQGYFQEALEEVAFSFESMLTKTPARLSSDVGEKGAPHLVYAVGVEHQAQQQAWSQFFQAEPIVAWWQQAKNRFEASMPAPVVPEELDVAARLRSRRQTRETHEAASTPSLVVASIPTFGR